jgi:aminopeptidase
MATYCAPVKPGDLVAIHSAPLAEALTVELVREVAERGGSSVVLWTGSAFTEAILKHATEDVLDRVNPVTQFLTENANVRYILLADENTRALSGVDPARQARVSKANRPNTQRFMERQSAGDLLWSLALVPTHAYAQDAGMSLSEFSEFVYEACFLNDPDPAQRWRDLGAEQQRLVDHLKGKKSVRVVARDTDLSLSVEGRTFINADGRKNFPDGEFFTGPVEDSVNGTIRYSFLAIFGGREVEDIRLRFEGGRVVEASAGRNNEFLQQMLDMDEGARRLGEFAVGNNYGIQRFTRNILFDEKIGGTVHLALGASYPDTGGVNQSALHWDMICDLRSPENGGSGDGGEVWVDGELFLKDGRILM